MRVPLFLFLVLVLSSVHLGCGSGSIAPIEPDSGGGNDVTQPSSGDQPPPVVWPTDDLTGGVVATFEIAGETFRVWAVNEETIQKLETGPVHVVQSVVHRGPGNCEHNLPWSWHLDPLSTFVEGTDCGCHAYTPSEVEANLEDWVNTYCMLVLAPVELVDLQDYR